jgi:hypothetical protein
MTGNPRSALPWAFANRPTTEQQSTAGSIFDRETSVVAYYGSGKAALRDGLAAFTRPGQNVLLPAYLPDGVREPLLELGLEPRYYRMRATSGPDLGDLERRIDVETAAVVSVDYFGFPQPSRGALESLLAEHDCYHVEDAAHAALSIDGGQLLGTRGDLGFTSLRKQLPVPDGALLYCNAPDLRERLDPSSLAGVRDRFDVDDCLFVAGTVAAGLLDTSPRLERSMNGFLERRSHGSRPPPPTVRYEAGKRPMSKLSAKILETLDPSAIRADRRTNYRAWLNLFADRDAPTPIRPSLPTGLCPQVFPVRTDEPKRLLADLDRVGIRGAHAWPRLDEQVRADPAYETARTLAREVVLLPVGPGQRPSSIRAAGVALGR